MSARTPAPGADSEVHKGSARTLAVNTKSRIEERLERRHPVVPYKGAEGTYYVDLPVSGATFTNYFSELGRAGGYSASPYTAERKNKNHRGLCLCSDCWTNVV